MKGVLLCGGLGTRLRPLTQAVNKHLLPVYNQPMCHYGLRMLAGGGIKEVLMVVGGQSTEALMKTCKDGRGVGLNRLYYAYQEGEGGIAAALALAEEFVNGEPCCVVLGDNILGGGNFKRHLKAFLIQLPMNNGAGARVLLKKVANPKAYGVPVFEGPLIRTIEEKPQNPKSDYAVIGVYFYDFELFDRIRACRRSARGELEITDVNNQYAEDGRLQWSDVGDDLWLDAGESIEGWLLAHQTMQKEMSKEEYPELLLKK